jgi:hypothetical protein
MTPRADERTVSQLQKLNNPSTGSISVLREWLRDPKGGNCFLQSSEAFLWEPRYDGDFVTLSEKDQSHDFFTAWFTSTAIALYHNCWGHKQRKKGIIDPESGLIQYSDEWYTRVGKALTTTIASILPVLAVLALYFEKELIKRIYIMIGITAVFAAILSLLTNAKRIEIFAAVST